MSLKTNSNEPESLFKTDFAWHTESTWDGETRMNPIAAAPDDATLRDLAWAEELQSNMRSRGLADAGRLISPVLRPCFLSRDQADRLADACSRVSALVARVETTLAASPELMQRIGLLPAEKVLAADDCERAHSSFTCSMEACVQNGTVRVCSVETCQPVGLGYSHELTKLFDKTPPVSALRDSGCAVTALGDSRTLLSGIRALSRHNRGPTHPRIAVLAAPGNSQARLTAGLLSDLKSTARLCSPDQFSYSNGVLRAAKDDIDLVFRSLPARDLMVQAGLSHPVLRAWREGAARVVNGFKSEVLRRRAILGLLTESPIAEMLTRKEAESVRTYIPWTRLFSRRPDSDLLPFARENRRRLVLRPAEDGCDKPVYQGANCADPMWDTALRAAAPGDWVLQEQHPVTESFPVMHYGEVQHKNLQITIHAHVIGGQLGGAVAQLSLPSNGSVRPLGLAPVFVVERPS